MVVRQERKGWPSVVEAQLGYALSQVFPDLLGIVREDPLARRPTLVERLIAAHVLDRAVAARDYHRLGKFHEARWRREPPQPPGREKRSTFEASLVGPKARFFDELAREISRVPCEALYELGCGDGALLGHWAERLPKLRRLIGIDLNESQIEAARLRVANARVELIAASAVPWLFKNGLGRSVFITHGGVLAYLPPNDVLVLFDRIADRCLPSVVALMEPVLPTAEAVDRRPPIFGPELYINHDYPRLLADAGFRISHREQIEAEGHQIQFLIASIG
jgi:SAM-dependent methyltransferase